MPELVTIGSLSIDGLLLSVLLSSLAGITALSVWIRRSPVERQGPWVDLLINMLIITGLFWKLGFLIWQPELLWQQPMSLIIIRGSIWDAGAGLLCSLVYLFFALRRRSLTWIAMLDRIPLALLPGLAVWNVISQFPYRVPYAVLCLLLYIFLLRNTDERNEGRSPVRQYYLLGMGFGGLTVSLFTVVPQGELFNLIGGLTIMQWVFILHALCGAWYKDGKGMRRE